MTKNTLQACFWHPQREATHIVNLGTPSDKGVVACDWCAEQVRQSRAYELVCNASIVPITRDVYDRQI